MGPSSEVASSCEEKKLWCVLGDVIRLCRENIGEGVVIFCGQASSMEKLSSVRESTSPQNRQLTVHYHLLKYQVDSLCGR